MFRLLVIAERSVCADDDAWLTRLEKVAGTLPSDIPLMVRHKEQPDSELLAEALFAAKSIPEREVLLNGPVESARALNYDGAHLPESLIRPVPTDIPHEFPVGASIHSEQALRNAEEAGADYVIAGAVYNADSKTALGRGLDWLSGICNAAEVPVLAIGGMRPDRVADVAKAGAYGVAVIAGIFGSDDLDGAIGSFTRSMSAFPPISANPTEA